MKTQTEKILDTLRAFESPDAVFIERDGSWPIVWESARGVQVRDVEGKKYIDLTAAFGVAAAGHANPRVVVAGRRQMGKLLHAMGDVHPHALKAKLARELSRVTFERWTGEQFRGKTIFNNSGFEAVEAALKTAILATGKRGVIAFNGAYHGLGYGALNATHRDFFRAPFRAQLGEFGCFVPFPKQPSDLAAIETQIREAFRAQPIGAILTEPVQARGGINIPPPEFLPLLRRLCNEFGALLIVDEIYTGFGRTGKWFACEHSGTLPDLICLGKALTGGFPLSTCVGRADIIDTSWKPSTGEALHTSTFMGHPVGCAMALAQIAEIESKKLPQRAAALGDFLLDKLRAAFSTRKPPVEIRGLGLMAGIELPEPGAAMQSIKAMLKRGYILLPEGETGNVISITPPLTITRAQLEGAVKALRRTL